MQERGGLHFTAGTGATIAAAGVTAMITSLGDYAVIVGSILLGIGSVAILIAAVKLRQIEQRQSRSPLVLSSDPHCCRFLDPDNPRVFVGTTNPPDSGETVTDVELYAQVVGAGFNRTTALVMKWVGEKPTQRPINPGGHHHSELVGIANGQHYIFLQHSQIPIQPGEYRARVSVRARDKQPVQADILFQCVPGAISGVRCVLPVAPPNA